MQQLMIFFKNLFSRQAYLPLMGIAIFFSSCAGFAQRIMGDGHVVTQSRPVSQFNEIRLSGAFQLILKQDSTARVEVETDENIQPYVIVEQNGDVLIIREKPTISLYPTHSIRIFVSAPDVRRVNVSGASNLSTSNNYMVPRFDVKLSGASKANLILSTEEFHADCSGASKINLQGKATLAKIEASGASKISAENFAADQLKLDLSGASKADVYVLKKLDIDASGASKITYRGNPQVNQSTSGASKIVHAQ
ncbi:MAG: DUF2807 domain-containing protein [Thermoflavifilum sp.]|nr:DUF2807 domain-containing protein [Thermoflavifilum sp.]